MAFFSFLTRFSFLFLPQILFFYLLIVFGVRWFFHSNSDSSTKNRGLKGEGTGSVFAGFVAEYLLSYCYFFILTADYLISFVLYFSGCPVSSFRSSENISSVDQEAKLPIVLIHGYMMRASTFWLLKYRLKKYGWKYIYTVNYFSFTSGIEEAADVVRKTINDIEQQTGHKKFILICHSMGGLAARYYITHLDGEDKVEKLVMIGTPNQGSMLTYFSLRRCAKAMKPGSRFLSLLKPLPEGIEGLAIGSDFDQMVIPNEYARIGNRKNVRNVTVSNVGHLCLLFSKRVFLEVVVFIS